MCNENYTIYFGEMLQIFQQSTSKCFSKCFISLNKIRNVFQLFRRYVISVSIYPTNAKSVSLFWTMCKKCFTFFDKVQKMLPFFLQNAKIFQLLWLFQFFWEDAKSVSVFPTKCEKCFALIIKMSLFFLQRRKNVSFFDKMQNCSIFFLQNAKSVSLFSTKCEKFFKFFDKML